MSSPGIRRDFFISFNSADRGRAEWIASELEAAGYTTFFQHWDFRPGSNFVIEMHKAASLSDRTIAVLSPDYLTALFTQPEWAASLVQDPDGRQRKLIPVRVRECAPEGILKPIVYADLVGLDEPEAKKRLLAAVAAERPKPAKVPFPPPDAAKPVPLGNVRTVRPAATREDRAMPFAALSLGCFLLFTGILAILLWKVETLAAFGLTGRLFYLALIPLALAASGFLFGVLRSRALYRGKKFGGTLELGGPIVAFAMVVAGGFYLPPSEPLTFGTTVYVHGPAGPQDTILRGRGHVVMDLGGNRRLKPIDEKGAAHFPGIPAAFRGQEVPVSIEAEGFERTDAKSRKLSGESLYVAVRQRAGRLYGVILDEQGAPIQDADLDIGGAPVKTNGAGRFEFSIPGDRSRSETTLDVRAEGFRAQSHTVVPGANEIRIRLERAQTRGAQ